MRALPARVYTLNQAASILGIGVDAVRKGIQRGCPHNRKSTLPGVGKPLVDPEEVRRWRSWRGQRPKRTWAVSGRDVRPGVIYALKCPLTDQVRYIGKTGKSTRSRLAGHLADADKSGHRPVCRWIRKLRRNGLLPVIEVLQECLPGTMDACEQEWIARGKAKGWKLLNIREGGEGGAWNAGARQRQSELCKATNVAIAARRMGLTVEQYREQKEEHQISKMWNRLLNKYHMAIASAKARGWHRRKYPRVARAIRTEGDVAYIPLTRGQVAIIDVGDVPLVEMYSWAAQPHRGGYRAKRTINAEASKGIELLQWRIMERREGQMVSFRNGNTLDCRRCNLILVGRARGNPCHGS